MSELILGYVPEFEEETSEDLIRFWRIDDSRATFPLPLQKFLTAFLALNRHNRPNVAELKEFELFSNVTWDAEALLKITPPYSISEFKNQLEHNSTDSQSSNDQSHRAPANEKSRDLDDIILTECKATPRKLSMPPSIQAFLREECSRSLLDKSRTTFNFAHKPVKFGG